MKELLTQMKFVLQRTNFSAKGNPITLFCGEDFYQLYKKVGKINAC
jgi:hypothetical protein